MNRTESVLDEQIVAVGQRPGEDWIVARLTAIEARVFEHGQRAREELAQPDLDGFHRQARIVAFGPSQVRADCDRGCAVVAEELERRERRANAGVIGYAPVFERDVEVGPDEDALARDVCVTNRSHLPRPSQRRFGRSGALHHPFRASHQLFTRRSFRPAAMRTRASTATQPSGRARIGFRSSSATSGRSSTSRRAAGGDRRVRLRPRVPRL